MASGTADLQRDLGGAVMPVFGALLTAGYAAAMLAAIGSFQDSSEVTASVQSQLTMSQAGAASIATQYPQSAPQILDAAEMSFLEGASLAYTAGIVAVLAGAALVFFLSPKHHRERELLAEYHGRDVGAPQIPDAMRAPTRG